MDSLNEPLTDHTPTDKNNDVKELEKVVDELINDVKQVIEKSPQPPAPTLISEDDYQSLSKKNFETEIRKWVDMVKNGQVSMSDVPKSILLEVRARI